MGCPGASFRVLTHKLHPPEAIHSHLAPPRTIGCLADFGNFTFTQDA